MDHLIELRKTLHSCPELSGQEAETQKILVAFLRQYNPSKMIQLASGRAMLVEFDSGKSGPHIVYRADLDALPVAEENLFSYASKWPGVAHKCGHDGHMALACSLPEIWNSISERTGKLGLLFQHAEEIAVGAKEIIEDPEFKAWGPDMILGMHNLPGHSIDEVVLSPEIFSCASLGLRLSFIGIGSHAAEPEKGRGPWPALQKSAEAAQDIVCLEEGDNFFLSSLVHLQMGNENYGINPGEGKICFTLRAKHTELLLKNKEKLIMKARALSKELNIKLEVSEFDFFPATSNSKKLVNLLSDSATSAQLKSTIKTFPFRWSEDFGYYSQICPSAFFGMGNGEESLPLHHPEYDFNDKLFTNFRALFQSVLAHF